mgnify:CR=1 FL=1
MFEKINYMRAITSGLESNNLVKVQGDCIAGKIFSTSSIERSQITQIATDQGTNLGGMKEKGDDATNRIVFSKVTRHAKEKLKQKICVFKQQY